MGIFGNGGFAKQINTLITLQSLSKQLGCRIEKLKLYVVDNGIKFNKATQETITEEQFFQINSRNKYCVITVATSFIRQEIAQKCRKHGVIPLEIKSPLSSVDTGAVISDGAIIANFASIECNAKIGAFFHLNMYSYVAHDCVIGDFVTFAPRVSCNGNVRIGDNVFVGTGAILRQGSQKSPLTIGEGAIIGMGAVVTKNVAEYATVIGNPARILL